MWTSWARSRHIAPEALLKATIVVGVIFLSAFLAPRANINLLILLAGIGSALVLIRKPELGLISLLIGGLCIPFTVSTNTQASFHVSFFLIPLLSLLWLVEQIAQRKVRLVPALANKPILLLIVFSLISFVAGNLPWIYFAQKASVEAQVGAWTIYVFSFTVFLLAANRLKLHWLKILCWLFLTLGSLFVLSRWLPPISLIANLIVIPQAQGSLFFVWFVALAGGQALFNRALPIPLRTALGTLALAMIGAEWIQTRSWASGWLPPLVSLGVLLWLKSWRMSILIALAAGLAFLVLGPNILNEVINADKYSIDTRFLAMQVLLGNLLPANPLLGLGFANYYHAAPLYPVLGWYVRFNSHNQYVDIVMQMGVIGLSLFVWLVVALARMGRTLQRVANDEFSRGYACACLGGLAGSLIAGTLGDWFLPFLYNIGINGFRASMVGWIFLGGLVVVQNSVRLHGDA